MVLMESNTIFTDNFKEISKYSKMWRNMVPLVKYGSLLYEVKV